MIQAALHDPASLTDAFKTVYRVPCTVNLVFSESDFSKLYFDLDICACSAAQGNFTGH